jgi:hypothetical protein
MNNLSMQDLNSIKKVRQNLMKIKETGTAPINLIRYQKMGLIKKRVYKTSKGQLKDVKLSLTDKGKRILNARL